jgi:hypothetical protein
LTDAILRMGKLTGPAGQLRGRASSGVQVAVERTDLDNEMSATACQIEQVERELIRLAVSRQVGRLISHDELRYGVEYNKTYVLASVGDILAQAKQFTDLAGGDVPEMRKLFLTRVLDAAVRKNDPRYNNIASAIAKT